MVNKIAFDLIGDAMLRDLLQGMLAFEPSERPSISFVIQTLSRQAGGNGNGDQGTIAILTKMATKLDDMSTQLAQATDAILTTLDRQHEAVMRSFKALHEDIPVPYFCIILPAKPRTGWKEIFNLKGKMKDIFSKRAAVHFLCVRKRRVQGQQGFVPIAHATDHKPLDVREPKEFVQKLQPIISMALKVLDFASVAAKFLGLDATGPVKEMCSAWESVVDHELKLAPSIGEARKAAEKKEASWQMASGRQADVDSLSSMSMSPQMLDGLSKLIDQTDNQSASQKKTLIMGLRKYHVTRSDSPFGEAGSRWWVCEKCFKEMTDWESSAEAAATAARSSAPSRPPLPPTPVKSQSTSVSISERKQSPAPAPVAPPSYASSLASPSTLPTPPPPSSPSPSFPASVSPNPWARSPFLASAMPPPQTLAGDWVGSITPMRKINITRLGKLLKTTAPALLRGPRLFYDKKIRLLRTVDIDPSKDIRLVYYAADSLNAPRATWKEKKIEIVDSAERAQAFHEMRTARDRLHGSEQKLRACFLELDPARKGVLTGGDLQQLCKWLYEPSRAEVDAIQHTLQVQTDGVAVSEYTLWMRERGGHTGSQSPPSEAKCQDVFRLLPKNAAGLVPLTTLLQERLSHAHTEPLLRRLCQLFAEARIKDLSAPAPAPAFSGSDFDSLLITLDDFVIGLVSHPPLLEKVLELPFLQK